MSLAGLVSLVAADPPVAEAIAVDSGSTLVVPRAATAPTIAALASGVGTGARPVLAVTATGRETDDLVAALGSLLPRDGRRLPGLGDAAARATVTAF